MRLPDHRESNDHHSKGANGARARQKELQAKRLTGQLSCAECKRLKLKCDKKVPCSACKRRGCQTICPLGELSGGQGGRLVLAETDELHRTVEAMSKRIRQLEDALQTEHSAVSTNAHPLLRGELLDVKKGLERGKQRSSKDNNARKDEKEDDSDELLDAMGLLTISEGGDTRYLGTSGSEQALLTEVGIAGSILPDVAEAGYIIPDRLCQENQFWPFKNSHWYGPKIELHVLLEFQLPSRERASSLGESYLSNMYWFSRPVTREQIMEELIPLAYKRLSESPEEPRTRMDLHDLALLYMIFAVGASADLTLSPYNIEAERYRRLARAALGLKSVFDGDSMSAVQAIFLMGTYDVASGRRHSMESAWKLMCLAFSLGTNIGLHRDPARWHLDPKIIQRRRQLCWEMCVVDNWKSLSTGRPPSFTPDVIDCEFPDDQEAVVLDDGTVTHSLTVMKYRFAKEVLSGISVRLCSARPPKYSEILEMDHQVREFDMQPTKRCSGPVKELDEYAVYVRHCALSMFRDRVLLHIHRTYFAQALMDFQENPFRSPFYPSFLATYRSATSLLKNLRESFASFPHVFLHHWPLWGHALAASVIIGSVITRSPKCCLVRHALKEFEQTIKLFVSASLHPIVRQGVPILMRMYKRIKASLESVKAGTVESSEAVPEDVRRVVNSFMGDVDERGSEDILKILMETTRTELESLSTFPPSKEMSNQNYSNQNLQQTSSAIEEPIMAQVLRDTSSYGNGDGLGNDPFSALTGTFGVMSEGSSTIGSVLGLDGSSSHIDKQPSQSTSSNIWPSSGMVSADDSEDQMHGLLNLMLPGWRGYLQQDPTSPFSNDVQQGQNTSELMNVASNTFDVQPDLFPFGGFDPFGSAQMMGGSEPTPAMSSSSSTPPSSTGSSQAPVGDTPPPPPPGDNSSSFLFVEPNQISDFSQAAASLSDFSSLLPLVDGDRGVNAATVQPVDETWQSFVSSSGFQSTEELLRSWQVY